MPRRNLRLSERKDIVNSVEKHSRSELAAKYRISKSQINRILLKKDYLLDIVDRVNTKLTRVRHDKVDIEHDEKVMAIIEEYCTAGIPINPQIVRRHAGAEVAEGGTKSQTWWRNFKRRQNVTSGTIWGEVKSSDTEAAEQFKLQIPNILHDYTNSQIYNFDETRFFFKMMPSKSYARCGRQRRGVTRYKDAVSVCFFVSMSGDQLRPIIIGHHENPRLMKKYTRQVESLPVDYYSTPSSFMTRELFETILSKWNQNLIDNNEEVVLLLDNASQHKEINISIYT